MFLCNRQSSRASLCYNPANGAFLQTAASEIRHLVDSRLPAPGAVGFDVNRETAQGVQPPALPQAFENKHLAEVISLVAEVFVVTQVRPRVLVADHKAVLAWLDDFLQQRAIWPGRDQSRSDSTAR